MAAIRDNYTEKLEEIAKNIESAYGLDDEVNNSILEASSIEIVIECISKKVVNLSKQNKNLCNVEAGRSVVLLAYLLNRMKYFNKKRLDFSAYPCMLEIIEVLIAFTNRKSITKETLNNVNKIIQILSEIDTKLITCRYSLGYRYLRIFVLLVIYQNYFNACIVASFILEQLIVSND